MHRSVNNLTDGCKICPIQDTSLFLKLNTHEGLSVCFQDFFSLLTDCVLLSVSHQQRYTKLLFQATVLNHTEPLKGRTPALWAGRPNLQEAESTQDNLKLIYTQEQISLWVSSLPQETSWFYPQHSPSVNPLMSVCFCLGVLSSVKPHVHTQTVWLCVYVLMRLPAL